MKSSAVPQEQKNIMKQIIVKEFMSSESSDVEELEDGTTRSVMVVRQLPWRGKKATRVLKRLDSKANNKKSMQSKQQTIQRVVGEDSTRPKPYQFTDDFWGFTVA